MPIGYFLVDRNEDIRWDIKCELHKDKAKEEVPEDQRRLYIFIEETNNVISSLNISEVKKLDYSTKLLTLAQAGLTGATAQAKLASASVEKLREEILLKEAGKIKNNYMIVLGKYALIFSILALFSTFIFESNADIYLFVWCGTMMGTWISFGVRKLDIEFKELSVIEDDRMRPIVRLIFVGISAMVLTLLLKTNLIQIKIGDFNTLNMEASIEMQILLGVLCGLLESKLAVDIYNKASDIIKV